MDQILRGQSAGIGLSRSHQMLVRGRPGGSCGSNFHWPHYVRVVGRTDLARGMWKRTRKKKCCVVPARIPVYMNLSDQVLSVLRLLVFGRYRVVRLLPSRSFPPVFFYIYLFVLCVAAAYRSPFVLEGWLRWDPETFSARGGSSRRSPGESPCAPQRLGRCANPPPPATGAGIPSFLPSVEKVPRRRG